MLIIQYPEEKRGHLRAVAYNQHDTVVYDDLMDRRQAVWNELDLDAAVQFMDVVNAFLVAYKADVLDSTPKTRAARIAALDGVPPNQQAAAMKIAQTRWPDQF
jgi:hypothetical protein